MVYLLRATGVYIHFLLRSFPTVGFGCWGVQFKSAMAMAHDYPTRFQSLSKDRTV